MAGFNFLELRSLLRGQIGSHFPVRLGEGLVNATTCFTPDRFKLGRSLIYNWRYLLHLLVGQSELKPKMTAHPLGNRIMISLVREPTALRSGHKRPGDSARDENEHEAGDQFPFQCLVHWPNSS